MRFMQRCTASSLVIFTSGLVPARSCLACRLAVDLEVCSAVACRIAGRRVPHSPQAAAPAATPSAQQIDSARCMSRCRSIRASCFAAGAGHPARLAFQQSHGRHPTSGKKPGRKKNTDFTIEKGETRGVLLAQVSRRENVKRFFVYIFQKNRASGYMSLHFPRLARWRTISLVIVDA